MLCQNKYWLCVTGDSVLLVMLIIYYDVGGFALTKFIEMMFCDIYADHEELLI